jgi:hypothetical protein
MNGAHRGLEIALVNLKRPIEQALVDKRRLAASRIMLHVREWLVTADIYLTCPRGQLSRQQNPLAAQIPR